MTSKPSRMKRWANWAVSRFQMGNIPNRSDSARLSFTVRPQVLKEDIPKRNLPNAVRASHKSPPAPIRRWG